MTEASHNKPHAGHMENDRPLSSHIATDKFGLGVLSEILDTIEDSVTVQDRDLRIIYANEATRMLFGRDIEGKHCYEVFQRRTDACEKCPVIQAFSAGKSIRDIRKLNDANGKERVMQVIASPLRGSDGEILACIEVARGVTGQERAREELVIKNRQLEKLTAISRDIATGLDLETILAKLVKYAAEATKADAGLVEILDRERHRYVFPYSFKVDVDISKLSIPEGEGAAAEVMRSGEPMLIDDYQEFPLAQKVFVDSGARAVMIVPLVDGDDFIGLLGLGMLDDGTRKFTQEDLDVVIAIANQAVMAIENARLFDETRRRMRILNELTMTAVSITSGLEIDKILTDVVKHAAGVLDAEAAMIALLSEDGDRIVFPYIYNLPQELTGLSRAPGKGLADTVISTGEPAVVNDYLSFPERKEEFVKAGVTAVATVPLNIGKRCIGAVGVMDTGSGQQFNDKDIEVLSIIADQAAVAVENARLYDELSHSAKQLESRVQERTEALSRMFEESERRGHELDEAYGKLKELDLLKSEFLANMSHELRTPLNSIIGFSKLMLDGLDGEINEEQQHDLAIIHKNGQKQLRLIDDLLDLAKIEAGRVKVDLEIENPADIVRDAVESLETTAEDKGLSLEVGTIAELEPITLDKSKTRQILTNLIENAIKYTSEGGIKVSVAQSPEETVFSVSDTGAGLTEEEKNVVFNRFQRGRGEISGSGGAGLGLTLSRNFAELQGGRIWVESEPGEGSTFNFALPTAGNGKQ